MRQLRRSSAATDEEDEDADEDEDEDGGQRIKNGDNVRDLLLFSTNNESRLEIEEISVPIEGTNKLSRREGGGLLFW